ncbi:hypothetical protein MA16_Dca024659 [Dendrobium catenatum]|uniref:Uncharacterized protein n=1 Tax=Dendrobium catenatum TaxID=906689 RepID=A0A2I0VBJ5_9ASPA|nr:hypothetical protein MA16_Dca024659 [Dendrobium catenatum]
MFCTIECQVRRRLGALAFEGVAVGMFCTRESQVRRRLAALACEGVGVARKQELEVVKLGGVRVSVRWDWRGMREKMRDVCGWEYERDVLAVMNKSL